MQPKHGNLGASKRNNSETYKKINNTTLNKLKTKIIKLNLK